MTAQIILFPGKRRVIIECAEEHQDVRETFANMIVDRKVVPAWLRFLSDHSDPERSGR